jgi:hypothetical protein
MSNYTSHNESDPTYVQIGLDFVPKGIALHANMNEMSILCLNSINVNLHKSIPILWYVDDETGYGYYHSDISKISYVAHLYSEYCPFEEQVIWHWKLICAIKHYSEYKLNNDAMSCLFSTPSGLVNYITTEIEHNIVHPPIDLVGDVYTHKNGNVVYLVNNHHYMIEKSGEIDQFVAKKVTLDGSMILKFQENVAIATVTDILHAIDQKLYII